MQHSNNIFATCNSALLPLHEKADLLSILQGYNTVAPVGSQFFIVATDSVWPPEGGGYTIFGNVTSGMEIIDQVVEAGVAGGGSDGSPALPLSILQVAVNEK